jgi:hypothetical protein
MRTSLAVVLGLAFVMGAILIGCTGSNEGTAPAAKAGAQTPPAAAVSLAEQHRKALDQAVTVNAAESPGGERLTVQYAAIAICKAVGVPYQWDKSSSLAGDVCRRFIPPLNVSGVPGKQALTDLLSPLGVRFEVDDSGVYLCR